MTRLETGVPVRLPNLTLVPIHSIRVHTHCGAAGFDAFASKEPLAVVVVTPAERLAFDTEGASIDWRRLAGAIPGLDAVTRR
jgi:hypothetical protein